MNPYLPSELCVVLDPECGGGKQTGDQCFLWGCRDGHGHLFPSQSGGSCGVGGAALRSWSVSLVRDGSQQMTLSAVSPPLSALVFCQPWVTLRRGWLGGGDVPRPQAGQRRGVSSSADCFLRPLPGPTGQEVIEGNGSMTVCDTGCVREKPSKPSHVGELGGEGVCVCV